VTHDPCRILNVQIVCPDAAAFVTNLGPGDDTLTFNGPLGYATATLHGGAGNDHLSASIARGISNATTIFGDAGDDRLVGGSGPAELHGGDGNDTLLGDLACSSRRCESVSAAFMSARERGPRPWCARSR
jgi:hypothetical protein